MVLRSKFRSHQGPAHHEQLPPLHLLAQLALDVGYQVRALTIDLVLGVEEGAAAMVALGFQSLDRLLPFQLRFQRKRGGGAAPRVLDLAVEFLDFALQAQLQIVRPAFELLDLGLENPTVPLGNAALDGLLLRGDDGFQ